VDIFIDNDKLDIYDYDQQFDVPPFIYNDRTLLPLRKTFEIFGLDVNWNGDERSVSTVTKEGKKIWLQIDNNQVKVDDEIITLDVPAKIFNNRTFVPVRFITETVGYDVSWDGATRSVRIFVESTKETAASIADKLIGDEIKTIDFTGLPVEMKNILLNDYKYETSEIESIVEAKFSLATQLASGVIKFGNTLTSVVDLAFGAASGTKEVVKATLEGTILGVTSSAGSEAGEFAVRLYSAGTTGAAVGNAIALNKAAVTAAELAESAAATQAAVAMLSAWILSEEMKYINDNMDQSFKDLWKFNPASTSRLKVYAIYIDSKSKETNLREKGIRFYYWNESSKKYVNYYNNIVYSDLKFTPAEVPVVKEEPSIDYPYTAESNKRNIEAFAYNWFWSKGRNQDGRYGETSVTIELPAHKVSKGLLFIQCGYSQKAGTASATVYISTKQQVTPPDSDHHRDTWWVGNDVDLGLELGTINDIVYNRKESSFDITSFINQNVGAQKFYITVKNNAPADIGFSGIYISAEVADPN